MTLILGMDPFVFIAWIGTILAAIFCVIYGIYYEFIKQKDQNDKQSKNIDKNKKETK
jgi:predicted outer membrane lipoprotein